MNVTNKPFVWLHGAVKSPPFSRIARLEAGFLLQRQHRELTQGDLGKLLQSSQARVAKMEAGYPAV